MSSDLTYHEAPRELLERKDALVAFMGRYLPCPIAVAAMAAYDVLTGESLGTEGLYALSEESYRSSGPHWTLTEYHNFKEHGVIVDDGREFEDALWKIVKLLEDEATR